MDNPDETANPTEDDGMDRPSWLAVASGLNLAIAISYLACKPPQTHTVSLKTRLFTSACYILLACLAGSAGTWIALSRDSRKQFRALLLCGVRSWVFLPATMMFLRERSVWTPVVAVLSAALMATHWNRLTAAMTHRSAEEIEPHNGVEYVEKDIFITQLRFKPISWSPLGVSLCLYGAFLAAVDGELALLTLLLGAGAFLLASQIATAQPKTEREEKTGLKKRFRPYASHPYTWIAAAFCCAFLALSASSGTSELVWKLRAFHVLEYALAKPAPAKQQPPDDHSSEGYRVIVLWPIQKKEKVIPSPPSSIHPSSPNRAKPWMIPFYGPYWYFKTPGDSPGPKARTARGDPLKVNVRSTNTAPLLMEAHQNLSDFIDLTCCREIQVVFKNDISLGASGVGILLTDSHSAGKPSQNLGIKHVVSDSGGVDSGGVHSATNQPLGNTSPVERSVSFPLPKSGKIRKFDQITVVLLPDAKHLTAGSKVAIEKFVMLPN